ncbi:MAG: methyl-accepting chemotaxis protein [Phormidium sp.]
MPKQMRLGLIVPMGFGAIFLVMLGIGIVSKITMERLAKATELVSLSYEIKLELKQLEKLLVDAETGQRGFIYAGLPKFLEPYNQSRTLIAHSLGNLSQKLEDDLQKRKLNMIEELARQKMEELATTIILKRSSKEQELRALVVSGKGRRIMDQIRANLDLMIKQENALQAQRIQAAKQAEIFAQAVSIGGTLIAILIGSFIVLFISRQVVQPINQVASAIAASSTEIASTVEQQERTATHQAAAVNETTTTMDELGISSQRAANQAATAANTAKEVLLLAASGNQAVKETQSGMLLLKAKVNDIAEQTLILSQQTYEIANISNLVSDLANQTNMLALNAAVEAVRAGEQGKGFGVVAAEIRKLADQSKKSAEKINSLINAIQNSINSTVIATDEGTKTVDYNAKTTQKTADTFTNVTASINEIVLSIQQISLSSKEQSIAIQQVVDAMNSLNQAAAETASGISQTKISTQNLNEAAMNLKTVV